MPDTTTIYVKNELPHLLEAVCMHPNCPDWLKDAIWDKVHDQSMTVQFTATAWTAAFEAIDGLDATREPEIETPTNILDATVLEVIYDQNV